MMAELVGRFDVDQRGAADRGCSKRSASHQVERRSERAAQRRLRALGAKPSRRTLAWGHVLFQGEPSRGLNDSEAVPAVVTDDDGAARVSTPSWKRGGQHGETAPALGAELCQYPLLKRWRGE